jgi:hypothetical protein
LAPGADTPPAIAILEDTYHLYRERTLKDEYCVRDGIDGKVGWWRLARVHEYVVPCRDEADPLRRPNKETVVAHKRRIEPIRRCALRRRGDAGTSYTDPPQADRRSVSTGYAASNEGGFTPKVRPILPIKTLLV